MLLEKKETIISFRPANKNLLYIVLKQLVKISVKYQTNWHYMF